LSIDFGLLAFDWPQGLGIGGAAIIGVHLPQRSNKSDCFAGGVELKAAVCFPKVNLTGCSSDSRPAEMVARAQRSERGKPSSRAFGYNCFPFLRGRGERSRAEGKRDY